MHLCALYTIPASNRSLCPEGLVDHLHTLVESPKLEKINFASGELIGGELESPFSAERAMLRVDDAKFGRSLFGKWIGHPKLDRDQTNAENRRWYNPPNLLTLPLVGPAERSVNRTLLRCMLRLAPRR